jgi:flagellar biogenesis protein FliO
MPDETPPLDLGASAAKMFLSLLFLIALLFISYWFIRRLIRHRLQKGMGTQSIHILEKRAISPKTVLYLVESEGTKVLFAESQLEIKRLSTSQSRELLEELARDPHRKDPDCNS